MKKAIAFGLFAFAAAVSVFCLPVRLCDLDSAGFQANGCYTKDQAALVDIFEDYVVAQEEGDVESWIELWDSEGVQMPPNVPMRVGKTEIWKAVRENFGSSLLDMYITPQEVVVLGNFGYVRGVFGYTGTPKTGGDSFSMDGKFLTIFRKQPDGSWLIFRDIFSSNRPS